MAKITELDPSNQSEACVLLKYSKSTGRTVIKAILSSHQVITYDSLILNVPFMGVLTYCVASGELPTEAAATTPVSLGTAKLSYV